MLRKHRKAEVDCRCLPRRGRGPGEQGGLSQIPMGARFAYEPSEISLHPLQGWGTRDQLFLFSESTLRALPPRSGGQGRGPPGAAICRLRPRSVRGSEGLGV